MLSSEEGAATRLVGGENRGESWACRRFLLIGTVFQRPATLARVGQWLHVGAMGKPSVPVWVSAGKQFCPRRPQDGRGTNRIPY